MKLLAVWLALGKVLLALGLILFTFIAMLGGNPLNEYGFPKLPERDISPLG